ncbi:hypothetical protein GCM10011490_08380 [Pseudoclavibacter endophyticus]|uniref:Uncharacterized protein n=1 Tax=Pseudoclavibacter endophyticus TaxID=1778590 RepID=A0A6H9WTV9_9MICO|nr:hypothetical protein [Pseudoclavibacter endophyticus]KAB1649690.1 hypothetical protein F8O04_05490 [Pseudoclavibacter endophyticus]GGA60549.1 hypothetical protein GCM10011490_08380 [Pseudoclavibacter endophyticus]
MTSRQWSGTGGESPSFATFHRHAGELRDMQRELLSRQGEDPADIIEAEASLPTVLEIAIELALDDAQRHGDLSVALAHAAMVPDVYGRGVAIAQAWAMAGEAIVWEAGQRAAPIVRAALERRGVTARQTAPRRDAS